MGKERVIYYDSVAGILLMHMILQHCCQWSHVNDILRNILYFFMPWFFFKNGSFFRPRSFKEEFATSFKRLVVPFMVFSTLGTIVLWTKYLVEGSLTLHSMLSSVGAILIVGAPIGNMPLWFLLSLFCVRMLYATICNILNIRFLAGGGLSALWILVFVLKSRDINLPLYLSNVSTGFMFFSFGYLAKKILIPKIVEPFILIAYALSLIFLEIRVDMRAGVFEPNCFYWVPFSILGIYSINIMSKYLLNKPNIFAYIGKNTMGYYCIHWIVILIVSMFFADSSTENMYFFSALVLGNVILLPILTNIIKKSRFHSIIE